MTNYHKAYISSIFILPIMIAIRLSLIIIGVAVVPIAVTIATATKSDKFIGIFWLWDNDEDGYTGNINGDWLDNYIASNGGQFRVYGFKRWLRSVNWSMIRNPVNNMQRAKFLSWSAENPDDISINYKGGERWVIAFKAKGGLIYHLSYSGDKFRFGLKLKPWYYPEYGGGKVLPIEDARKRTTYTAGLS